MNKVEALFLEALDTEKFYDVINDDFSFLDLIIDNDGKDEKDE